MDNLESCCFIQETFKTCAIYCWHLSLAENQTTLYLLFFELFYCLVPPSILTSGFFFFVYGSVSIHFCLMFLSPPHFLLCLQPISSTSVKVQGLEPLDPCCLEVLALISLCFVQCFEILVPCTSSIRTFKQH